MAAPLSNRTMVTQIGSVLGTPEMGPEQLDPAGIDVDTRADGVCALGSYSTSSQPVDRRSMHVHRLVRGSSSAGLVARPGTAERAAVAASVAAGQIAGARRTDVSGLTRLLRGDLDWILLKALRPQPPLRFAGRIGGRHRAPSGARADSCPTAVDNVSRRPICRAASIRVCSHAPRS